MDFIPKVPAVRSLIRVSVSDCAAEIEKMSSSNRRKQFRDPVMIEIQHFVYDPAPIVGARDAAIVLQRASDKLSTLALRTRVGIIVGVMNELCAHRNHVACIVSAP